MFLRESNLQSTGLRPTVEFQAIILGGSSKYWAEVFEDDLVDIQGDLNQNIQSEKQQADETNVEHNLEDILEIPSVELNQLSNQVSSINLSDSNNQTPNNSRPQTGKPNNKVRTRSSSIVFGLDDSDNNDQVKNNKNKNSKINENDGETDWELSNCTTLYKGKPILHHQLRWLESARIQDVIVLCPLAVKNEVIQCVEMHENSLDNRLRIQVIGTKEDEDESILALLSIKDKIKSDFLVMSGIKFVNTPPQQMLDLFRARSPTMISMFYDVPDKKIVGKENWKREEEFAMFTGIDLSKSRLLIANPMDSITEKDLKVRLSLLKRFPRVSIFSTLRDSRVYIFKQFVIDILIAKKDQMISIRRDLIKLLTQCQYRPGLITKSGIFKILKSKKKYLSNAQNLSSTTKTIFKEEINTIAQEDFYHKEHFSGSLFDKRSHKKNASMNTIKSVSGRSTRTSSPQRSDILLIDEETNTNNENKDNNKDNHKDTLESHYNKEVKTVTLNHSINTPISGISLAASDISIYNTTDSANSTEVEIYCAAVLGQSIYI